MASVVAVAAGSSVETGRLLFQCMLRLSVQLPLLIPHRSPPSAVSISRPSDAFTNAIPSGRWNNAAYDAPA